MGRLIGIKGNIGGVGFSMLLLLIIVDVLKKKNLFKQESEEGIRFWSDMYIPVVVAMTSIQNVAAAVNAGLVALLGGVITVAASFFLIRIFSKIGSSAEEFESNVKHDMRNPVT